MMDISGPPFINGLDHNKELEPEQAFVESLILYWQQGLGTTNVVRSCLRTKSDDLTTTLATVHPILERIGYDKEMQT